MSRSIRHLILLLLALFATTANAWVPMLDEVDALREIRLII